MGERQTITPALAAMARQLRGHGVSGRCHIWFDDGNYKRHHVAWIAGTARGVDQYHRDEDRNALAFYLARIGALYLTDTQRHKLAAKAWEGYNAFGATQGGPTDG